MLKLIKYRSNRKELCWNTSKRTFKGEKEFETK